MVWLLVLVVVAAAVTGTVLALVLKPKKAPDTCGAAIESWSGESLESYIEGQANIVNACTQGQLSAGSPHLTQYVEKAASYNTSISITEATCSTATAAAVAAATESSTSAQTALACVRQALTYQLCLPYGVTQDDFSEACLSGLSSSSDIGLAVPNELVCLNYLNSVEEPEDCDTYYEFLKRFDAFNTACSGVSLGGNAATARGQVLAAACPPVATFMDPDGANGVMEDMGGLVSDTECQAVIDATTSSDCASTNYDVWFQLMCPTKYAAMATHCSWD